MWMMTTLRDSRGPFDAAAVLGVADGAVRAPVAGTDAGAGAVGSGSSLAPTATETDASTVAAMAAAAAAPVLGAR